MMNEPTDFEIELERVEREISELEASALGVPVDSFKATKYVHRLYQRASLTGNLAEFEAAERAIDEAIRLLGYAPDLYFLKASIDFKLHRLAATRRDLETIPALAESFQGRVLCADLDFQEGRYEEARAGYEALIEEERTWDNLARLAHLKFRMGDAEAAERLYVEAEDELTAKEMRSYAWVELQRGLLNLKQGRYDKAREHYERAGRAYSGYWLVDEHMAELLGAEGKYAEAAALYEKVIARVPKPELQQALGELYELLGKPEEAQRCFERALSVYLESAERGDVHYYHHLVDFYADVRGDAAEAVRWARKDMELRRNFSTEAALAWALYRAGQLAEAFEMVKRALASGARDAHLFF
ncbi:MAG TPA: tetratricopeptide repeat protein, partial [Pyrinomonadaceae bacterium]|nr:tetratricopeptide repeat protein [Pyrinomonadaceae bacterium]